MSFQNNLMCANCLPLAPPFPKALCWCPSLVWLQRPAVQQDVPDVLPHAELLVELVVAVSHLHI